MQFAYDDDASSGIYQDSLRLQTVSYPGASRVMFYDYGTDEEASDRLGRIEKIRESNSSGTVVAQYAYNGTGRLVISDYLQPQVRLDLYQGENETYFGFDRFGRTIDHRWDDYELDVSVARLKYGYDYAGNRTWREDVVAGAHNHDEFYTYDGLNRLVDAQRGNLTGTFPNYTGIAGTPAREEDWTLDQLGNWSNLVQKTGGTTDLDQDREHNAANEITEVTTITGPQWEEVHQDAAGNITWMPCGTNPQNASSLKYDAWNRLVGAPDDELEYARYEYDGLGRRIVRTVHNLLPADETIHYYYNGQWQLVEERKEVSGTEDPDPRGQYAWHPYYIDALAVRYWDGNADGDYEDTNEGAHYYLQDANFNVTAVVNASGTPLERYSYTPYGEVTFLEDDFDEIASSAIGNNHLYTGRERDPESGLQLNRNRYYAPHLGRWLTRDPIEYAGREFNLYCYVADDPYNAVDPFGLAARPILPGPGDIPAPIDLDDTDCFATYRGCISGCQLDFLACMAKGAYQCEVACAISCLPAWYWGHWGYGICFAACTGACAMKALTIDWHLCIMEKDACKSGCESAYKRCCDGN